MLYNILNMSKGTIKITDRTKAGVILFSPNKKYVLLVKTKSNGIRKCKWGFPKGSIELNENISECAMRELKEETGLIIDIDNKIIDNIYIRSRSKTYYYCYILNNNMMNDIINCIKSHKDTNNEIDKIAFVPISQCFDLILNKDAYYILLKPHICIDIAIKL
jgi:8-oxo-dGTP pyrophosphatase MutT (NUDIX family)